MNLQHGGASFIMQLNIGLKCEEILRSFNILTLGGLKLPITSLT